MKRFFSKLILKLAGTRACLCSNDNPGKARDDAGAVFEERGDESQIVNA